MAVILAEKEYEIYGSVNVKREMKSKTIKNGHNFKLPVVQYVTTASKYDFFLAVQQAYNNNENKAGI